MGKNQDKCPYFVSGVSSFQVLSLERDHCLFSRQQSAQDIWIGRSGHRIAYQTLVGAVSLGLGLWYELPIDPDQDIFVAGVFLGGMRCVRVDHFPPSRCSHTCHLARHHGRLAVSESRMAEAQGFEPWGRFHARRFSRPVHSTTLPNLRSPPLLVCNS